METLFIMIVMFCVIGGVASVLKIRNLISERNEAGERVETLIEEVETIGKKITEYNNENEGYISEISNLKAQIQSLEDLKVFREKYNESRKQIEEMTQNEEELLQVIDLLTDRFEDLKQYSFEVYNSSKDMYMFLLNKLNKGFLEDNEDVHELANKMKTFIINGQNVQDKYSSLFLVEDSENEDEEDELNDLVEDIEVDAGEFADDIDTDSEYYNDEEEIEFMEEEEFEEVSFDNENGEEFDIQIS